VPHLEMLSPQIVGLLNSSFFAAYLLIQLPRQFM
jgi:hypothetical protein